MSEYRMKRTNAAGLLGALCVLAIAPAITAQTPAAPARTAASESERSAAKDEATNDGKDGTEKEGSTEDASARESAAEGQADAAADAQEGESAQETAVRDATSEDSGAGSDMGADAEAAAGSRDAEGGEALPDEPSPGLSEPTDDGEISAGDVTREERGARSETEKSTARSRPRVITIEDDSPPEPSVDPNTLPYTHHQLHYDLVAGARLNWVGSAGYDVFAEDDVLAQFAARAGVAFWSSGRWSVAGLLDWSYGSTSATARGQQSALAVQRIGVGIEGRYHLHERVFTYLRVSPGAMFTEARIGREADPASQFATNWAFSLDGVVGAAVRLAGPADGTQDVPRLHFYLEGGYGFATDIGLSLSSDAEEGPARPQPLGLGTLSLSAPMVGAGLLLTL